VLLGDFLAGLRLVFDAADGFEIGKSGGEFGSRDAQRGLKGARSVLGGRSGELRGVAMMAREDAVERSAGRGEVFHNYGERDGAGDQGGRCGKGTGICIGRNEPFCLGRILWASGWRLEGVHDPGFIHCRNRLILSDRLAGASSLLVHFCFRGHKSHFTMGSERI